MFSVAVAFAFTAAGGMTAVASAVGVDTLAQQTVRDEYRGRVFESRFLPKALLTFVVPDEIAEAVVAAAADAARSGNESGDGLVWTTTVAHVTHNRTGSSLEEVEVA